MFNCLRESNCWSMRTAAPRGRYLLSTRGLPSRHRPQYQRSNERSPVLLPQQKLFVYFPSHPHAERNASLGLQSREFKPFASIVLDRVINVVIRRETGGDEVFSIKKKKKSSSWCVPLFWHRSLNPCEAVCEIEPQVQKLLFNQRLWMIW